MKYIDGGTIYEVEKIDYWKTLRTQAAIAAMQGLVGIRKNDTFETIAKIAVQQADALMEELKKTDNEEAAEAAIKYRLDLI